MKRTNLIAACSILGNCLYNFGKNSPISAFPPVVANKFYQSVNEAICSVKHKNGWFTEAAVRASFLEWGKVLTEENLEKWLEQYPQVERPKNVGLILAGNIPLVGFHDILSTVLSGNKAIIKLSSDDSVLIPFLMEILVFILPELVTRIKIVDKLEKIDAVIATGSDNTARYFEKYFGHLPNIIRKNRTSIAILTGNETKEELQALGKDIFSYFGLGCRNVSHLVVPKNYNLDNFFGAIIGFSEIVNHNKYANNYDYYKAIYLLNEEKIIENGFLLTKETEDLFAPIGVLHYHYYDSAKEIENYTQQYKEKLQVIIGKNYIPFGTAQCPALNDYADGVDTMSFLSKLG